MDTSRWRSSLLCGVILGVAGSGAQAATAAATIANVHVQVIDLNPDDGVTATVDFTDSDLAVEVFANATANQWVSDDWHHDYRVLGAAAGPFSAAATGASSNASVFAGDSFTAGSGPTANADAFAAGPGRAAYASGSTLTSAFTLSPFTRLVLSADAIGVTADAAAGEYALGYAEIALSAGSLDGYAVSSVEIDRRPGGLGERANLNPRLLASITNDSANEVSGYAYADAGANALGTVPEPSAVALMMTGVLLVSGLSARRSFARTDDRCR